MPIIRYCLFLFLIGLSSEPYQRDLLDQLKWKHRVVLIKHSADSEHLYRTQLELLGDFDSEYLERKVLVFSMSENHFKLLNPDHTSLKTDVFQNNLEHESLPDFEIVLIGLDGTVKLKSVSPITKAELFELIDSMPMRQNEIDRH